MAWVQWLSLAIVAAALPAGALYAYGAWRWTADTRALLARLEAARSALPSPVRYDERELDGLPAPVQRFFRAVLRHGQPIIDAANVEHTGTFNTGEDRDRWRPFTSQQRVVTRPPGFVWNGRVSMLPGLPVHVHDAYVAREGVLRPAVLGIFTLMDLHGTAEVAQGELMRYLAEASWYPTALLPGQGVRWAPIDDRSARATLADGPVSVTLTFRFDDRGLIESVRADARGRTGGKATVMTPWEGRWSNYQERGGILVPLTGEVAWLTPEGRKAYWRGTIRSLGCEFRR
jgi:hypothetical protein